MGAEEDLAISHRYAVQTSLQSWARTASTGLSEELIGRPAKCFVILWTRISTWVEITGNQTSLWCEEKPFKML